VAARQVNDFEPTVFAAHPDLAAVRQQLSDAGALIARMSGSGSTLFGVWEVGATLPAVKLPAGWAAVETATA
jgi:4-diphosphocytidyl-2-C-methyl-D-erythritol kinase